MTQALTEPTSPIRVWVVVEDEPIRRLVERMLDRTPDIEVIGAESGVSGLVAQVDQGMAGLDVVLCDARVIRHRPLPLLRLAADRGWRILVLKAADDRQTARDVAGVTFSVLEKPFSRAQLAAAVTSVATGRPVETAVRDTDQRPSMPAQHGSTPADRSMPAGGDLTAVLVDELRAADESIQMLASLVSTCTHAARGPLVGLHGWGILAWDETVRCSTEPAEVVDAMERYHTQLCGLFDRMAAFLGSRHPPKLSAIAAGDLLDAAGEGARHHHAVLLDVRHPVADGPVPIPMETRRAANLVWAAVRAVANASPMERVLVEARAVPAARADTDQVRFGRIRVAAPSAETTDVPPVPRWRPPFVSSQLRPDDAVVVMAGARDGQAVIDIWFPLVEP